MAIVDQPIEHHGVPVRTILFDVGGVSYQAALFEAPGQDRLWTVTAAVQAGDDPGEQVHVISLDADHIDVAARDLERAIGEQLGLARPHLDRAYQLRRHRAIVEALSGKLS